ncbi:hypothetical protein [Virgibacillus sediminis]|uniref:Uncharacterized protein n=1 Tax=Virgibacillus sediminis TaxID=202260 RepID=A0ABV7A9W9_9BACI
MRGMIAVLLFISFFASAGWLGGEAQAQVEEREDTTHEWVESSTTEDIIHADSHEYTYWKNFLRVTRTCEISHRVTTTVYYCDAHNHTKSETNLDEIIHSGKHR